MTSFSPALIGCWAQSTNQLRRGEWRHFLKRWLVAEHNQPISACEKKQCHLSADWLLRTTSFLKFLKFRCFLLIDGGNILIYNYEGRPQATIKYQGMRPDSLNERTVALSSDTVAIKDKSDEKHLFLFDSHSGKSTGENGKVSHSVKNFVKFFKFFF